MAKACVICGGDETSGDQLLEAPCQRHWVCTDDVGSFFERATENESLYPPKCCGQIFLLDLYEGYVPFDIQWAYQMKEQGEYSVLAKYRVYCASPACSKFLSPSTYVKDQSTNISYAICQDDVCRKLTCTSCKTLLDGVEGHTCEQNEDYKKFKQTAAEKGFQECPTCASTVELAEACNHITCECGTEFCYICGEQWQGMHGCPHYGPAIYDEEGYNQDGYHRTTGLNREGRTRREQARMDREEDGDEDEEDDEEDNDADANHLILQHVEPGVRATFAALAHEDREMFLVNLQIQLFEDRGITFGIPGEDDEDGGSNGEEDNEDDESDGEEDNFLDDRNRDEGEGQVSDGEEENGVGQTDNAEEEVQNNERTGVGIEEDVVPEALDVAMAEAMQPLEDSMEDGSIAGAGDAQMAGMMQFLEDLADPDDATLARAIQNLEDSEEGGTAANQYLSILTEDITSYEDNNANGIISPRHLSHVLRRMRNHVYHEIAPRETIRGALEVLDARFPGNAEITYFRLTLSHVGNPFNRNNLE